MSTYCENENVKVHNREVSATAFVIASTVSYTLSIDKYESNARTIINVSLSVDILSSVPSYGVSEIGPP